MVDETPLSPFPSSSVLSATAPPARLSVLSAALVVAGLCSCSLTYTDSSFSPFLSTFVISHSLKIYWHLFKASLNVFVTLILSSFPRHPLSPAGLDVCAVCVTLSQAVVALAVEYLSAFLVLTWHKSGTKGLSQVVCNLVRLMIINCEIIKWYNTVYI